MLVYAATSLKMWVRLAAQCDFIGKLILKGADGIKSLESVCSQFLLGFVHSWFDYVDFMYITSGFSLCVVFFFFLFCKIVMSASFTFPSCSWPCILYMYPCYGFQWSNISHLLSLLKIYAFEEFWYVFWIFQMQVILWIFDIRIWMIFIFTAMTEIYDLLSSADCINSEKWATFFPLYKTAVVFSSVFLLHSVKFIIILLLLPLTWVLRNKMQISYGNQ